MCDLNPEWQRERKFCNFMNVSYVCYLCYCYFEMLEGESAKIGSKVKALKAHSTPLQKKIKIRSGVYLLQCEESDTPQSYNSYFL